MGRGTFPTAADEAAEPNFQKGGTTVTSNTLSFSPAIPAADVQQRRRGAAPHRAAARPRRRFGILGRCLVALIYAALLTGYGYWVSAGGHEPPPPLSRVY